VKKTNYGHTDKLFKTKFFHRFANNKKALLWSAILSLVLIIISYFYNNLPLFTGENLVELAASEWLKVAFGKNYDDIQDSVLLINVAYDRQLTGAYISQEDKIADKDSTQTIGTTDITDRDKLYKLLSALEGKNYKYIFLDIAFYNNLAPTPYDEKLFKLIERMDRIVVAYDRRNAMEHGIADSVNLWPKVGCINYKSTITETNFKRLRLIQGSMASMPLKVYQKLDGKDVTRHGIIYTSDGHLCNNSIFVEFPFEIEGNNPIDYYKHHSRYLGHYEVDNQEAVAQDCDNRYVVIGDLDNDLHDTYAGMQPGPILMYKAYKHLKEGHHIVSLLYAFCFFILYFIIAFFIIKEINIIYEIPFVKKSKSDLLRFIVDMTGYGLILFLVAVCIHFFFSRSISILLPTTYFSIMKLIVHYKHQKANKL